MIKIPRWTITYAMLPNNDNVLKWYRTQTWTDRRTKEVQMPFKCTKPITRYSRTSPVQSIHATKNTVLQLVMWYKARILPTRTC
jgi:hypothetical protein